MDLDEPHELSGSGVSPSIDDWLALAKQAGNDVPLSKTVKRLKEGIRWSDVFPPGKGPSLASLRTVLRLRLARDPKAFDALTPEGLASVDVDQALGLLRQMEQDDRLPLQLDELCALPPVRIERFLAEASGYEKREYGEFRADLVPTCHFLDFVKERLFDEIGEVRYGRTVLGPPIRRAPPMTRGKEILIRPRYTEHRQIWNKIAPDDGVLQTIHSDVLVVLAEFERHVSAFDPAPIQEIVSAAKPAEWPSSGRVEDWFETARQMALASLKDLRGSVSTQLRSAVGRITSAAVSIASDEAPVRTAVGRKAKLPSSKAQALLDAMQAADVPKRLPRVGKRLIHALEASHAGSEDAVRDLLVRSQPKTPRADSTEGREIWDKEWLENIVTAWQADVTRDDGTPNQIKTAMFVKDKYASWVRALARFAIRQWWPETMQWQGRSNARIPAHGTLLRWQKLYLDLYKDQNFKTMLGGFSAKKYADAQRLHALVAAHVPPADEQRPADEIHAALWESRWRRAAFDAMVQELEKRVGADGAPAKNALGRPRSIWRFAGVALSDLTGGKIHPQLALPGARWTTHPDALRWLGASGYDDGSNKGIVRVLAHIERQEHPGEHRLLGALRGSRPSGSRPADGAADEWDNRWVDEAVRRLQAGLRSASSQNGAAPVVGTNKLRRFVSTAIDDLISNEKEFPFEVRDRLFFIRDRDRPFRRVYHLLADANGKFDRLRCSIDAARYPVGIKAELKAWLRSEDKISDAQAEKRADGIRRDGLRLVEQLTHESPVDPETGLPWPSRCYGRELTAADVDSHETMMASQRQWALFLKRPTADEMAYTVQNERVAGWYGGILSISARSNHPPLPPGEHSNRTLSCERDGQQFNFSASAFGTSMSLVNVALLKDPTDPSKPIAQYDQTKITARWVPMHLDFTANTGALLRLAGHMLVVSDRIFKTAPPGVDPQVRVNCEEAWLATTLAPELGLAPLSAEEPAAQDGDFLHAFDDDDDVEDPMDLDYRD